MRSDSRRKNPSSPSSMKQAFAFTNPGLFTFSAFALTLACLLSSKPSLRAQPAPPAAEPVAPVVVSDETPEQHAARMAWWREARFGMFIHWGIYSVPAGVHKGKEMGPRIGEWI